jgi:cell division septation protein DedD
MSRIIDAKAGRLLVAIALILMSANVSAEISRVSFSLAVLDQDGKESHFTVRMGLAGFDPASPPQMGLSKPVQGLEVLGLSLRPSRQKSAVAALECECVYSGSVDFVFPDLWLNAGGKRVILRGERITRSRLGLPPIAAPVAQGNKKKLPSASAQSQTPVASPPKKQSAAPSAKPAPSTKLVPSPTPNRQRQSADKPQGAMNGSTSGDRLRVPVGTRFYAVPDLRSVNYEISAEEVEVKVQKRLSLEKSTEWLLVRLPNGEKAWIAMNKAKKGR